MAPGPRRRGRCSCLRGGALLPGGGGEAQKRLFQEGYPPLCDQPVSIVPAGKLEAGPDHGLAVGEQGRRFLADVERVFGEHGRCVVAVSEGVSDREGKPIALQLTGSTERDAHGNVQLSGSGALGDALANAVRQRLKIKRVRADTFGYLQRSFMGVVSGSTSRPSERTARRMRAH